MCSCNFNDHMPPSKSSPQILAFCQRDQINLFEQRQIPLQIDENLLLQYQIDDSFLITNHNKPETNDLNYQKFIQGYQKLTNKEFDDIFTVSFNQIKEYILQNVSCIGCRTSIDCFLKSLVEYGHPAIEPLVINKNSSISIRKCSSSNCDDIFRLFYIDGLKVKHFIETISKSKKNRRCLIHSLDRTRSLNNWEYIWQIMNNECRNEMTIIQFSSLLTTIEEYLRKFKFCSQCRHKVFEAYDLLIDNCNDKHRTQTDFCSVLYEGLQICTNDKHIHVDCEKKFISKLINRAEIEIHGGQRERHAKTLDAAQEEILTCIGIYLFEKFEKISRLIKSDEQIWKLVYSIGIECLRLNFEKVIEQKQDSNLIAENFDEQSHFSDRNHASKKRHKRKSRKQIKSAQTQSIQMLNTKQTVKISHQSDEMFIRRRTNSCCSCFCHYCDEQSNQLANILKLSFIKSHSCPSLLPIISNQMKSNHILPLSNSLDTLFSTMTTRECICHEKNLANENLCDECPISSSTLCIRCSTARSDLGYSSEQDDNCSSNRCECTSTDCIQCSTELSNCCPLYEEDESSMSMLSSGICSHKCCFHENRQMIELSDRTGKSKLTLELSDDYPFFQMNFKQIWEENSSINADNQTFISDDDRRQFFLRNKNFHKRREQLRRRLKYKFQLWKQSFSSQT